LRAVIKAEFGNGLRLGEGKVRLLELVAETGSISAAARRMDMSYRRAWKLVEELNSMFPVKMVDTISGGRGGGGASITPHGAEVVALFRTLQAEADAMVAAKFARLTSGG
jgi:molybdate transport system regulatory protein